MALDRIIPDALAKGRGSVAKGAGEGVATASPAADPARRHGTGALFLAIEAMA